MKTDHPNAEITTNNVMDVVANLQLKDKPTMKVKLKASQDVAADLKVQTRKANK